MIKISDITYGYEDKIIFKNFDFSIKKVNFLWYLGKMVVGSLL